MRSTPQLYADYPHRPEGAGASSASGGQARAGAWHNLGMLLASQGRVTEAERCLRRALELDPAAADAHNNLGVLLARLGRLEEAVRHLREAVRLDPSRADARANLARLDSALAADRK